MTLPPRPCLGRLAAGTVLAAGLLLSCRGPAKTTVAFDATEADYVGSAGCADCHQRETELWRGSHHDLAMQEATEESVLADFGGTSFTHFGVTSEFYRRDGGFFVRTDGADGRLAEFEIAYTFGVEPLQQYLVEFPDGRIQALGFCWDTRPADEGGQRWFHLYPDEKLDSTDRLHWTGLDQNWNHMCAECHTTNLEKNYVPATDRFATTFAAVDVSCEACHGPGSAHVAWAEARAAGEPVEEGGDRGLGVRLADADDAVWTIDSQSGIAERTPPRSSQTQLESCARCHARRSVSSPRYVHGRPLADTHRPALIQPGLYHADGTILGEVYVYGSFLQSKMHAAGVTCGDCHDPHSTRLTRGGADAACARCHLNERFRSAEHHFHEPGEPGSACVDCHMPSRTYMQVDPRRDHSFRIPRPDLSIDIGTPNACSDCHANRPAEWAAEAVERWYGDDRSRTPDHLRALAAGWSVGAEAERRLAETIDDPEAPGIFRASAAALLGRYLSPRSLPALAHAVADEDPLVRAAAAASSERLPPSTRVALAGDLLSDPVRLVRVEAARGLASVDETALTSSQRHARAAALGEYRAGQLASEDRPEAHANLGSLEASLGNLDIAEVHFQQALTLDPLFVPAAVNLADLYRARQRDDLGEEMLRKTLGSAPEAAALHHALGLALARLERQAEALGALGRAVELAPAESRFAYVYALALHSGGETEEALEVLSAAHEAAPADREVLSALATIHRDLGIDEAALRWARRLLEVSPGDPRVEALIRQLQERLARG